MKIEVIACDKDREVPARTYEITVSDGRTVKTDLCARHAEPFEALLRELTGEETPELEAAPEEEPAEQAPEVPKRGAAKRVAKKAPAKTAAKKTTSRRRPRITTLEEIQAQKDQG
ncbi:hypothetical protein ACIPX0_26300 [Streptomyces sp. NPDC090075]|uniref:hypothetical protein n=1 Tax=Streptomyces sp. NPDC090075 TaxID=3365937 RepID=UPI0037F1E241